jgi:hypothetical protein
MFRLVFSAIILFAAVPLLAAEISPDLKILSSAKSGFSATLSFGSTTALAPNIGTSPSRAGIVYLSAGTDQTVPEAVVSFIVPPGARPVLQQQSLALGSKLPGQVGTVLASGEAYQIRLIDPISVRGIQIAKVVVPMQLVRAGASYGVSSANISVAFTGMSQPSEPIPSDPFSRLLAQTVANWEEARRWGKAIPTALASDEYDPFSKSTNWVRVRTLSQGVYRITRTDLSVAGIDVASVDPATFRIFNAGGKRLPTAPLAPRDSLSEIAIAVHDQDGIFSGDDFIMFYATGSDFWEWSDGMEYNQHPYSDRNIYYLTWGGTFGYPPRRMVTINGTSLAGAVDTLTSYTDYLHFEENRLLNKVDGEIEDYFTWYWQDVSSFTLNFNMPAGLSGAESRMKMKIYGNDLNLALNGTSLAEDSVPDGLTYYYTTDKFSPGLNQFDVVVTPRLGASLMDYFEVYYPRPLVLTSSEELVFSAPEVAMAGAVYAYRVAKPAGDSYVLDITDFANQKLIETSDSDGSMTFGSVIGESSGHLFVAVTPSAMRSPASIVKTEIDDIRSPNNRADLIIITHDNFYSRALDFASYRRSHDNVFTRVVKISDIYAQFSGGLIDPVAIRDFLGYAYRNWSGNPPSYCLLVGDGVYDFRNNLGTGAVNYVPPYVVDVDSTVSDENFAYFDKIGELDSDHSFDTLTTPVDRGVDMVIARWPVNSSSEFDVVAEKMKSYESSSNFGRWRNLITLIADDQYHGSSSSEDQHTKDSETLADSYIPGRFDLNKIYAVDYPFGVGREKPEVREDIIRAINSGTLLVNYVGHGNPNVWADERIFRRTQDIPRLNNHDMLPLIFNASCSIGFFDDPLLEGMAEDFLSYAKGGAVGTVSATRLVYSRPNALFNQTSFYYLFGGYDFTIAEAVYVAKLVRQSTSSQINDRKYIYIGDPLTRLGFAPLSVDFEQIEPDSFVALTATHLSGAIKDDNGNVQSGFNGLAEVSAFDDRRQRVVALNEVLNVSYSEYGPEIYRGKVDVTNGRFDLTFVVPKDISYGGSDARISCYASDENAGAAGYREPIAIGGINTSVNDTTGPEIRVYFANDPAKTDGAVVNENARVTIDLADSLGINLSGEIGHAIEMTFDDDPALTSVLNDSFTYIAGSYQEGTITTHLPDLNFGAHKVEVKAWDSANNSSLRAVNFEVRNQTGLEIEELLCYPNPVVSGCEFSYVLTESASDVRLKIFTLSGLEIYATDGLPGQEGYNGGVAWNGRDADGDAIANGVYIFQLSASGGLYTSGGSDDNKATATGKLIIMK